MPTEKLLVNILLEELSGLKKSCEGFTCEAYFADWEKIRAAERAFEKIGQIAKDLGQTTLDEIGKTLPWRNIKGIRDIIAHEYAQIDHNVLWEVIHDGDLDALLAAVTTYARKKGY